MKTSLVPSLQADSGQPSHPHHAGTIFDRIASCATVVTEETGFYEKDRRLGFLGNGCFPKFGFVNNLQELLAEADVMITKPGGLNVSEALCAGFPSFW
jgi:UDP-N-acetylglucosamine:LPS N-acetylglucosamine transferase